MEIARAGPDGEVLRRHGLEIVVEHVRLRCDHDLERPVLAQEVGRQHFHRRSGAAARDRSDRSGECFAPPSARSSRSTEVTTTCFRPSLATASATRAGSSASSASGSPVATLQKAQARVQVSPMIMNVAWRFSQHSPCWGNSPLRRRWRASGRAPAPASRRRRASLALHPDPGRLAGDRLIRPVRFLGMAGARGLQVLRDSVDEPGHAGLSMTNVLRRPAPGFTARRPASPQNSATPHAQRGDLRALFVSVRKKCRRRGARTAASALRRICRPRTA